MSTNKDVFIAQLNALAEAINRKAGTEGKKSIPELTEVVNTLLNRAPTGLINITNTNLVDVADFAFAQVVDSDLVPYNIAKNVNILGVTGTLDAPDGNIDITDAGITDVREYATARVVDNDLRPENIKQGVNILGTVGMVVPRAKPIITNSSQEVSRQGQQGVIHLMESQYNELVELKVGESVSIDLSWLPYENSSGYFSSNLVAIKLDSTGSEYDAIFIACDFSSESPDSPDFKVRVLVFNLLGFTHLVNYKYIVGSSSSDATADASEILEGATAYVNNEKITGTIPTKAAETFYPSVENQIITSGQYLNGDQVIQGIQVTNLVAENIAKGVVVGVGDAINPARITNVVGTYESYPVINLLEPESFSIFSKAFKITAEQYQTLHDLGLQEVAKFTWPDIEDEQPVILTHFATKTGSSSFSLLHWEIQWFVVAESYSWDPQGGTIQGICALHNLDTDVYGVGLFNKAYLVDTSNGTATNNDLLAGKTAYSQGQSIVGTIPSLGAQTYEPSTSVQIISGGQYLEGPQTLRAVTTNLSADKILKGQTINIGSAQNPTGIASITGTAESYPEINATYRRVSSSMAIFDLSAADVLQLYQANRNSLFKLNFDQTVPEIGLNQLSIFITKMWNNDEWFFDTPEEWQKDSYWIAVEPNPDLSQESPNYYITDIRSLTVGLFLDRPQLDISVVQQAVNTSSATATAEEILKNKTAFVNGVKLIGTMDAAKAEEQQEIVLSFGTGSGSIIVMPTDSQHTLSQVEIYKPGTLRPEYIKTGINIAGIDGTYTSNATATENDILYGKTAFVNGQLVSGQILSLSDATYFPNIDTEKVIISSGKYLAGNQKLAGITFANLVASNIAAGVTVQVGDTVRGAGSYLTIQGTAERRKPESAPEVVLNLATGNQVVEPGENSVYSSVTILKPEYLAPEYIKTNINIAGVIGTYGGEQTPTEEKNVTLSFTSTSNPQVVIPTPGYALSKVSIAKPSELIPTNIKAGITIANIQGTYETPTEEQTVDLVLSGTSGTQVVVPSSPDVVLSKVTINKPQDLIGENIKVGTNIAGIEGTFTNDATVSAAEIFAGKTAYVNGEKIVGTFTTSNLTATSSDILNGKTAYVNGTTITGNYRVVSNTDVLSNALTFNTTDTYEVVPVGDDATEKVTIFKPTNLLPDNIRKDVIIAGIQGTYGGEAISLESKTVQFTGNNQQVIPSTGYDGLQDVTITLPNNLSASNIKAGVTIAGVTGTYNNQKPEETCDVSNLDFNNQSSIIIEPTSGSVFSSVTIFKPDALSADNIKVGSTVAGVVGTFSASDSTSASASEIIVGKTAYVNGELVTGTYAVPAGKILLSNTLETDVSNYATAQISDDNLRAENIAVGVEILGITGTHSGAQDTQTKTVNLSFSGNTQVITPDANKVLTRVTINKPVNFENYIQAGQTIAGITGNYTSDATAVASDIALGKTAYIKGQQVAGTFTTSNLTAASSNIFEGYTAYVNGQVITGTFTTSNLTAASEDIAKGKTAYVNGQVITGTFTTSNLTATAGDILFGKTAYVNGQVIEGAYKTTTTTVNNLSFSSGDYSIAVPSGYNALTAATIKKPSDLIAANIKSGVTIAGIQGTYDNQKPEVALTLSATDLNFQYSTTQEINPPSGNVFSGVTVTQPQFLLAENIKSGITIAGISGEYTADATAIATDLRRGTFAYARGVKMTGSMPELSATAYHPSLQDQTILAGNYLAGNQVIKGITISGLNAYSIVEGNVVNIGDADNPSCILSITGAAPGSSSVITTTVPLNLGAGNQTITAPADKSYSSVTVTKPTDFESYIKDGEVIGGMTGTYTHESLNPAGSFHILAGKIAYVNGTKITGTMPSKAAETFVVSSSDRTISSDQYLSGNQVIKGVVYSNLTASDILTGKTLDIGDSLSSTRIVHIEGTAWTKEMFYNEVNTLAYGTATI